MEFRKYQHIERFGTTEVAGIELGPTFIFPKIDGTNGSVWQRDGVIQTGSRNRHLSMDNDNAGFCLAMLNDHRIKQYLDKHPEHRLFGEWLVPHSLKTYRQDAWRKFYIFDVYIPMLLSTVFHELVTEETWNIVKKMKMPTINYKTLNALVIGKIKTVKADIF